jgi:hypothetical protein
MKKITTINSPVDVTAVGFAQGLRAYPRRIEFGGASYDFVGEGLHAFVKNGKQIVQLLTMSDGAKRYHLRSDNHGGSWTLLSISQ